MGVRELTQRLIPARREAAGLNAELRRTPALAAGAQVLPSGAGAAGGAASPLDAEALAGIASQLAAIDEKVTSPSAAVERRRFGG